VLSWNIPGSGSKTIQLAGTRIYTSVENTADRTTNIQAWKTDGTMDWSYGPLDGVIVGVAEDVTNRFVYVQTGKALYQFDLSGSLKLTRNFPIRGGRPPGLAGPFPPIVAPNGDVWVYDFGTNTSYAFTKNDTQRLAQQYPHYDPSPQSICVGSDGRFYTAANKTLKGYQDWDTVVAEHEIVDHRGGKEIEYWIGDLIMDKDDGMYTCLFKGVPEEGGRSWSYYVHFWQVNEKNNFSRTDGTDIDLSESLIEFTIESKPLTGGIEMAIGEEEKLVILHMSGRLEVYTNA
jgi:hypothetical protein